MATMAIKSVAVAAGLRDQISSLTSRGLTVSIENNHPHMHLRKMEYYLEAGECHDAPRVNVPPEAFGVGAFTAKFLPRGSSGMIVYSVETMTRTEEDTQLWPPCFLVIGWLVPLKGDNSFFVKVVTNQSIGMFPRDPKERKRVYDLVATNSVVAGNTLYWHAQPYIKKPDELIQDDDLAYSVCATMATSSIANLKVDVSAIMPNETVMLPLDVTPKKRVSLFSKLMDDPRVDMLKEYGEKAMGYGEMAVEKGKEFVFKKDSKPT